jgi:NAD(P)-dependent dehydrogenase (short-subunit alcohol dehydrogenase family)
VRRRLSKNDVLNTNLSDVSTDLNVLVNNAGANWGASLEEYPDAAFTKVLTLNLQRVFTLTQKLVPLLLASLPANSPEDGPWDDPGRL